MVRDIIDNLRLSSDGTAEKLNIPQRRKNVIFYFSDQQRWDSFNKTVMPNLYELSSEGVTFDNCFTCQPVCGPARACLQSGVYATEVGCFKNGISLPGSITPLAEYFNREGYDTAYIGKWHLASDSNFNCERTAIPEARRGGYRYFRGADVLEFTSHGYDGYVFDENENRIDFKGYRADAINNFALEYLDTVDKKQPFFMFVSQLEPHHQNDTKSFEGYRETVESFRNYPIPDDLKAYKGDYNESYPDYISAINRIDYNLGLLVEKLKKTGLYEDTVIIYTSDHGCHFKTRNMEYKRSCHDSSLHVPLVIRGGDFRGGVIDTRLVSLIDLPVTVLKIADIDVPDYFKGYDISDDKRQTVYVQISESQCGRAIRTKEYTYSVAAPTYVAGTTMSASPVYIEEYLYDHKNDPNELKNLIKDPGYKSVRKKLREMLKSEMKKAENRECLILPAIVSKKK